MMPHSVGVHQFDQDGRRYFRSSYENLIFFFIMLLITMSPHENRTWCFWGDTLLCSSSMEFRSRLCDGEPITRIHFFGHQSVTLRDVCLGSLSCWYIYPRGMGWMTCCTMFLYMNRSMLPSTRCNGPNLTPQKASPSVEITITMLHNGKNLPQIYPFAVIAHTLFCRNQTSCIFWLSNCDVCDQI
jgi:hypothetical protein